jgi:beta-glucanase (GH16 family)
MIVQDAFLLRAIYVKSVLVTLILSLATSQCWCAPKHPGKWKLAWSDEFNGKDGSAADASKWTLETGGNRWGNHELEYYTSRPENIEQRAGSLVITARKEHYTGADGVTKEYTSARLKTYGKFEQKYGRFEARIKIPKGQGMWPAFWLLGANIGTVKWPECGEIDIMENIGSEPAKVHGSMHGPEYSGGSPLTGAIKLASGSEFGDAFHVYAVEWKPDAVRFYVDGKLYETQTPDSIPSHKKWVFDHPFFIILNLAVGGDWPKNPNETTTFPQEMLIDYVRVYQYQ